MLIERSGEGVGDGHRAPLTSFTQSVPHPSRERHYGHRTHMGARDGAPAAHPLHSPFAIHNSLFISPTFQLDPIAVGTQHFARDGPRLGIGDVPFFHANHW